MTTPVTLHVPLNDVHMLVELAIAAADEIAESATERYPLRASNPAQDRRYQRDKRLADDLRYAAERVSALDLSK